MAGTTIFYILVDRAFTGDVDAVTDVIRKSGHDATKVDTIPDLAALVARRRPAAIICTLATDASAAEPDLAALMGTAVKRGIPVLLVGPGDPRQGVTLIHARDGVPAQHKVPFAILDKLVVKFADLARAAASGQKGSSAATPLPARPAPPSPPAAPPAPPRAADPPAPSPAPPAAPPTAAPIASPREAVPATTPAPIEFRIEESSPRRPDSTDAPTSRVAVEKTRAPATTPARTRHGLSLLAAAAAGVAIGAAVLAAFLFVGADRDAGRGPGKASTAPDAPRVAALPPPADRRADAGPELAAPTHAPQAATGSITFPGHFRASSTSYWFTDPAEERAFLDAIASRPPGCRVKITGHATTTEEEDGLGHLGLSRAWAVQKYLVRNGVPLESIDTIRGEPMKPGGDLDDRGRARNRRVTVSFE